jgi:hypothetical protein
MLGLLVSGRNGYHEGMAHAPAGRTWLGRLLKFLFGWL